MEAHERKNPKNRLSTNRRSGFMTHDRMISIAVLIIICVAWTIAARIIDKPVVLPYFGDVVREFFKGWVDARTLRNLLITIRRVLTGSLVALIVGLACGVAMGCSDKVMHAMSPVVNSIRQVPIMAWVPLAIVWFGIGDGPTLFLIFMSAVFPLLLNTISGIEGIDPNYRNAARSMGAGNAAILKDVVIPGAMPGILTGLRLAVGSGWMSVICAEFIATSSGFGYIMIEAQQRIQTSRLYALMIMSAIIGFVMDRLILLLDRRLTGWRFRDGAARG